MRCPARPENPFFIADVEDNAGGGASSDTTGLLRALDRRGADKAILALMNDPQAAALAHEEVPAPPSKPASAGARAVRAMRRCTPASRSSRSAMAPSRSRARSIAAAPRRSGRPPACASSIRPGDIRVVVGSVRNQCLDRAYFRHIGLTPENARIICVKSTVHFRADFDPIAQATLAAAVPGALASDLTRRALQYLRPGVRLGPGRPAQSPGMREAEPSEKAAINV
jgi:microcystin degradation protein MlrC